MAYITGAESCGREQGKIEGGRAARLDALSKLLAARFGSEATTLTGALTDADLDRLKVLFDVTLVQPLDEDRRQIQGTP